MNIQELKEQLALSEESHAITRIQRDTCMTEMDHVHDHLRNLLAIIHRDGGHSVEAVGIEECALSAAHVIYNERSQLEDLKDELEQLKRREAEMREALQGVLNNMESTPPNSGRRGYVWIATHALEAAQSALKPNAGSELLTREQVRPIVEALRSADDLLCKGTRPTRSIYDALAHARTLGL